MEPIVLSEKAPTTTTVGGRRPIVPGNPESRLSRGGPSAEPCFWLACSLVSWLAEHYPVPL
jgi:hypothetical protein